MTENGNGSGDNEWGKYIGIGMMVGAGFGGALSASLNQPAFVAVGIGSRLAIGIGLWSARSGDGGEEER